MLAKASSWIGARARAESKLRGIGALAWERVHVEVAGKPCDSILARRSRPAMGAPPLDLVPRLPPQREGKRGRDHPEHRARHHESSKNVRV